MNKRSLMTLSLAAGLGLSGCDWLAGAPKPAFKGVDLTGAAYAQSLNLTDQDGRARNLAEFKGKVVVIFFGYTQCPDVCPMTLLRLTEALELLGHDGDAVQPVFITIDPLRDTPDVIADYIANFDPRFIGLTGTRQQIANVERAFAVYAKAADGAATNANYLVDHTALTYLIGPDGAFRAFIQQTLSPRDMAERIREHL